VKGGVSWGDFIGEWWCGVACGISVLGGMVICSGVACGISVLAVLLWEAMVESGVWVEGDICGGVKWSGSN